MNVPDAAVAALTQAPDTVWEEDQLIGFGADGEVQPPGTGGYSTTADWSARLSARGRPTPSARPGRAAPYLPK